MNAVDLIVAKRDGGELSDEQINWFISGVTSGSIPAEQAAALLMAIVWRSLTARELATWTAAMINSGQRLDLSSLARPTVDKHSTGGWATRCRWCCARWWPPAARRWPQLSAGAWATPGHSRQDGGHQRLASRLEPRPFLGQLQDVGAVIAAATADLAPPTGCCTPCGT